MIVPCPSVRGALVTAVAMVEVVSTSVGVWRKGGPMAASIRPRHHAPAIIAVSDGQACKIGERCLLHSFCSKNTLSLTTL